MRWRSGGEGESGWKRNVMKACLFTGAFPLKVVCSLWQRRDTLQLWQIKLAMSVCSAASGQCASLLEYLESLMLRVLQQIAAASKTMYNEKGTYMCTSHMSPVPSPP